MKYKIVANQTLMISNVSALRALNAVINILKGKTEGEVLDIQVYYLSEKNGEPVWKLENGVKIK